jgi:hypothetical protein
MLVFGKKYTNSYHYYCDIILNVGTVTCGKEFIDTVKSGNYNIDWLNLNATMALTYFQNNYWLVVEGPNGGIYFQLCTDLTDAEMSQLIDYFKNII